MSEHGSLPALVMEGDRVREWIIRLALVALWGLGVWSVFGDDLVQLVSR